MIKNKKILMALMGLNIGGAETHVVELAKELKKEGYNVIIASNGGVYEKELLDAGIKHYSAPLNKRSIFKMIKSYFTLKKIIEDEGVDIVHSHARIPGFICGLLRKKMKFTFVTTAHWVFYTGMGLKYISDWGQKVIAVSDDIKDYLIKNYNIKTSDIYVTINGIDTDKFSPNTDSSRIKKEFNLTDEPTIIYVSRLDASRALVARQLIEITPKLREKQKRLRVIITGGGDVFDELKGKADNINKLLGDECITMTGARTDINEIISAGDIFVGVSRAALEAMASAKPVIVAGNEGYIGLFNDTKLALSMDSNFCCRGCEMSSQEALYADIIKAFSLSADERKKLGEYGREVIFEHYSVEKMAKDCLTAYEAAEKQSLGMEKNALMSGYYGFNNLGDEAILTAMIKNISDLDDNIKISVLSNNPEETMQKHDVNVIYRFSLRKVIAAIKECDILLSGGGSLLQDSTSTRSLVYYLSIILIAKFFGKKVMLYANGIGPVSKNINRWLVKIVVNKADLVTLREGNSYEELKSIGVKTKAAVTADPVFTLDDISSKEGSELLENSAIPTDKPICGVSVRPVKKWSNMDKFIDEMAAICDEIYEKYGRNILFIVMQSPNDINISLSVQAKMKNPSYILKEKYTPYEVMSILKLVDFTLSMRLHTLIFAAKQRAPLIGFVYDPKIEYYLKKLNMPSGGDIDNLDKRKVMKIVDDVVLNRKKYVDILDKAASELERDAYKNEEYLLNILNGERGGL